MAGRFFPILIGLCALLFSLSTSATSVLPVSLQRMASAAELIFYGKAIENEVKLDDVSGRVATFTTFEIIELIKGTAGATHTIKQIGGQLPGSNVRQVIHGVPRFTIGKEYVVFLPKASKLGFSSPVGLSQGRFAVRPAQGDKSVTNGRSISALLENQTQQTAPSSAKFAQQKKARSPSPPLSAIPDHPAKARLSDFLQTVRGMTQE